MLVGWWWGCWGILPGGSSTPFTSKLLLTPGLVLGHCGLRFGMDVVIQLVFSAVNFLVQVSASLRISNLLVASFLAVMCQLWTLQFGQDILDISNFLGRSFLDFLDSCCEFQFQWVHIMLVIS